ncbi:hypothetical protein F8M49_20745 [Rhodococcus zopfii]|uniref:Uncharacterized protein n=1 Tax=Rhodococcus zopfii TaxID=43772 RepID=A0ABU3WT15_9NOCA|nr:hypothetical protein [Rhodococcus zopfii]
MAEFATGGIVPVPDGLAEAGVIPVFGFGCDYVVPGGAGHLERGRQLLRRLNELSDTGEDGSR